MASPQHPEKPGRSGAPAQQPAGSRQEAPAAGPDAPGPEGHLAAAGAHSGMTTRELQEYWRREKGSWKQVKLLFEVASARVEERRVSKVVTYQIVVVQTGSFDSHKAVLERRFADFEALHAGLRAALGEELDGVALPRGPLLGGWSRAAEPARRRALQDYLRGLSALPAARRARPFLDFLTRPELRAAFGCLRAGRYAEALAGLQRALPLQEKLTAHCPAARVPALSAALLCLRDLERPREALAAGRAALRLLPARAGHRYLAPLLDAMVRLAYALGEDFAPLQARLEESQLRAPAARACTLKELTVREYLS